jgi:UPF0271 protein
MKTIDFNCDMGESFGVYRLGEDEAIMPFISSANIACGAHAGDPLVMQDSYRCPSGLPGSAGVWSQGNEPEPG